MDFEEFAKTAEAKTGQKKEWGPLATFVPNKRQPVYNWFYYKEGFSRGLVFEAAKMFSLGKSARVLDPFCGSGTTLLACKEIGLQSSGLDVLPVSVFASRVKTRNYDAEMLKENARELLSKKFQRPDTKNVPSLMKRAFSRFALEDIVFFMPEIEKIGERRIRDFFLLALMNAAMKVSYAWKDGAVIKIKKHPAPPLRKMLSRTAARMIKESELVKGPEPSAELADARMLHFEDESFDAVITSPPYLNQIDYTKVYAIEEFIAESVFREEKVPAVRSYIGLGREAEAIEGLPAMPDSAHAYFADMAAAIKEISRVLKPSGKAALVVDNAYFPEIQKIVDSDYILAWLSEEAGMELEKILILNERFALEERTRKKGVLRESMIVLEKP